MCEVGALTGITHDIVFVFSLFYSAFLQDDVKAGHSPERHGVCGELQH